MADLFECDKCHTVFRTSGEKKGRFLLEELGPWTDHPGRPPYKHEAFICAGCLGMLRSAISKPHKPAPPPAIRDRAADHCSDCGAIIQNDLSCTPGCTGMRGVREASNTIERVNMNIALGLMDRALDECRKVFSNNLANELVDFIDRMKAKGYVVQRDD